MYVQSCCFTHRICLSFPSKSLSPPWSSCLLKVPLSPLDGVVKKRRLTTTKQLIGNCLTSQLKRVCRLDKNVPRAVCQNFKSPYCKANTATYSQGKQNSLARDQVVYFETAGSLKCLTSAFILSTLFSVYGAPY